MSNTVISTLRDGVRRITLNRPKVLNAMSGELVDALALAFEEANDDEHTRAIVLTGNGKAFCAGADLNERRSGITVDVARNNAERIQRVTRAMVLGPKPIVGAINGWAVGGGFEWAIGCDFALWAKSARAFFPEVEWGLFVTGGASAILPAMVGPQKAKEMMLLGKRYDAKELGAMGIAWRVVDDAALMEEALQVATHIASLPARSAQDLKQVLNKATYADVETAMALEIEASSRAGSDPETMQRIGGFSR